jgi:SAM-dependent methyltransferase
MKDICRACLGTRLHPILDLGEMPLAGGFLSGPDAIAGERRFPLVIHTCDACGLVQITEPIDPDVLFQDYAFSSSTVGPLVQHFQAYASWLKERFDPRLVVEFGCNDGVLLDPLEKAGMTAVGVDISQNITDMARGRGLKAITGFFNADSARAIASDYGKADIVTGSNAFAHNDHPEAILEGAREMLKPDGHLVLEMMYAGDLLDLLQWDTLYHEHLTFYSLDTVRRLLERYGFHVTHAERIPMHGGALRIVAAMDANAPVTAETKQLDEWESGHRLNEAATWDEFGRRSLWKIRVVRDTFAALASRYSIWGYGAAGKATMWVNAAGMDYLGGMVDASPLRAGKLMPGTHTPIVFPDELKKHPPDYIFVTAWNYADLIRSKESWFEGIWSTPLPDLRFF